MLLLKAKHPSIRASQSLCATVVEGQVTTLCCVSLIFGDPVGRGSSSEGCGAAGLTPQDNQAPLH